MVFLFNFFHFVFKLILNRRLFLFTALEYLCIFVGAKFYYIGGPWRAYLSYRYNDIHSGFSLFIFIHSCF